MDVTHLLAETVGSEKYNMALKMRLFERAQYHLSKFPSSSLLSWCRLTLPCMPVHNSQLCSLCMLWCSVEQMNQANDLPFLEIDLLFSDQNGCWSATGRINMLLLKSTSYPCCQDYASQLLNTNQSTFSDVLHVLTTTLAQKIMCKKPSFSMGAPFVLFLMQNVRIWLPRQPRVQNLILRRCTR